eukprot:scaffold103477_cov29-Tisochrysis_lutea.AAC.1
MPAMLHHCKILLARGMEHAEIGSDQAGARRRHPAGPPDRPPPSPRPLPPLFPAALLSSSRRSRR